ncbi:MAG: hypothetical protein N2688_00020 [Burkholderiaceae bacterium]|nr:hypothetical protein [Burkholderiaceae bacterium]
MRLVEIVVQDIGDQEMIRLELSVPQAQQLLAQQDRLLVAIARARQHGRLANDAGAAAGGAA